MELPADLSPGRGVNLPHAETRRFLHAPHNREAASLVACSCCHNANFSVQMAISIAHGNCQGHTAHLDVRVTKIVSRAAPTSLSHTRGDGVLLSAA